MAVGIMLSAAVLGGCGQDEEVRDTGSNGQSAANAGTSSNAGTESGTEADDQAVSGVSELEVRFGDDGEPFMMRLEENETAEAIARYVGTSDWRLPIYERDDDADYDVMQYYDVSSRYDIPSNPETDAHRRPALSGTAEGPDHPDEPSADDMHPYVNGFRSPLS